MTVGDICWCRSCNLGTCPATVVYERENSQWEIEPFYKAGACVVDEEKLTVLTTEELLEVL